MVAGWALDVGSRLELFIDDTLIDAFLGGYLPRQCGIATFTADLAAAVKSAETAQRRGTLDPVIQIPFDPNVHLGLITLAWHGIFTAVGIFFGVWLLRSGSLAASAHGDRRRLRGRKWYDGVLLLLGAPWDLVRSIPSTILLALWSLGLAIAASLLCYAMAAGVTTSLFFSGLAFAASLWLGPGGSRVRSPISRTVHPASRTGRPWAVGMLVVLAVAAVLGYRVDVAGTSWTPGDRAPWSQVSMPQLPLGL